MFKKNCVWISSKEPTTFGRRRGGDAATLPRLKSCKCKLTVPTAFASQLQHFKLQWLYLSYEFLLPIGVDVDLWVLVRVICLAQHQEVCEIVVHLLPTSLLHILPGIWKQKDYTGEQAFIKCHNSTTVVGTGIHTLAEHSPRHEACWSQCDFNAAKWQGVNHETILCPLLAVQKNSVCLFFLSLTTFFTTQFCITFFAIQSFAHHACLLTPAMRISITKNSLFQQRFFFLNEHHINSYWLILKVPAQWLIPVAILMIQEEWITSILTELCTFRCSVIFCYLPLRRTML